MNSILESLYSLLSLVGEEGFDMLPNNYSKEAAEEIREACKPLMDALEKHLYD